MKPVSCSTNPFKKYTFPCNINDMNLPARERYHCLRRGLRLIMFFVAMTPVLFTAGLSFYQYRQLLKEDTNNAATWSTMGAQQNIETFLEKLRLSISVISEAYTFQELIDQKMLDGVFEKLKQENRGIVDLSVIGPDGVQRAYSGAFNLAGKNYRDSFWYNKTLAQKSYISEVFMGFRNFPHFVVAVSRKMADSSEGNWVLRASVDTETLDRFIATVNSEIATDAFLVNQEGVLQSRSNFYGKVNDKMSLPDIGMPTGVALMHEQRGGKHVIRTYTAIKDTPWILVLEHQQYGDKASWRKFKQQLLITFCVCAVIIIFSVYRIAGFVAASIRNSDELREAVIAQTEHSDRLASIGRLAAGVAHEINNPLAIIGAKTQLMQDLLEHETTFAKRDKFMSQLESVNNAVNRSQKITHRLLSFARRMEVRQEPVQVNEVIGEVLSFLEKEALYQNIQIVQDLEADLPSITSDQGQLQQILLNITNNAIDAAGKNGNILITTRQNDSGSVQIAISDNGPGMTPEVRNKIFEPFFTTKTGENKQGTGLGLSITYGIVKKLQGEIQVESEVGSGATFILTFPIKPLEKK